MSSDQLTPEQHEAALAAKLYPSMTEHAKAEAGKADDWLARLAREVKEADNDKANAADTDDKKDGGATDSKSKSAGAPTEYKDFTLPEGQTVDTETAIDFKAVSKEYGLTQEQAQKLVDMQASLASKQVKHMTDQWNNVQKEWRTKSTQEFGQPDIDAAKSLVRQYGDRELTEAIESSGMGNHPAFIRFLTKIKGGK